MSHFATPFIVVNLGCEMIYVIDQRLKAQNIGLDKSERVLTDIVTVLLHPKLLDELFIPQPVATHAVIKQLLQDISATSIMKLDDYSMSKLWDLMTMIFKWQLSVATNQNIFDISHRHLKCVANVVPQHFSKFILEQAIKRFESLAQRFTNDDYKCLHNTLILWFSEYHSKISVLLRLRLQRKDGTFSLPATVDPKVLQNLGENIYKYDNKKNPIEEYESRCADTNEISCLLGSIEKASSKPAVIELQLPIQFGSEAAMPKTTQEDLLEMLEDM
ncbi:protein OSCP1 isoform X2 [Hyposmocoma kahamanoa]|uniref:protein OSCP1 isoform X2 n=1 Tax=Hyposmocoma kahamanoa TaxID=1477025 RepID=UPI000E6D62CC|nr:protein OSCP1 isoform X2 [Hyposmocoma kahamanoa]